MGKKKKIKLLRQLAAKLPPLYVESKKRVTGAEILKVNAAAKDSAGNDIEANKTYLVPVKVPYNHTRAMKKAMGKNNYIKVKEYRDLVIDTYRNNQKMVVETVGGLAERKNQFTEGF